MITRKARKALRAKRLGKAPSGLTAQDYADWDAEEVVVIAAKRPENRTSAEKELLRLHIERCRN